MTIASMALAAAALPIASAQTLVVDHLTQSQLVEKAQELNAKAQSGDGSASVKLSDYPNHFTMISIRRKNGGAEIHENYSDIFFVVQGSATLVTGGVVKDAKTVSPGETRGASVQNGNSIALNRGDIAHIPATLPHQLLVSDGGTFVYFVIKVKEK